MGLRAIAVALLAGFFSLLSCLSTLPAYAMTSLGIKNLDYTTCPAEYSEGIVASGSLGDATCYLITGTAVNNSGKPVLDADVFGLIFDANDDPVMQNRGRVGSIEYVPPGESDFEFRISVAANQPTPLKLKKFKASGFATKVRR